MSRIRGWRGLPNRLKAAAVACAIVVVGVALLLVLWPANAAPTAGAASTTTTPAAGLSTSSTVPVANTSTTERGPIEITIAAVGDVMGGQSMRWLAWDPETKTYDFYSMFKPLAPYLQGADYTVANLETRLADTGPSGEYVGYRILNSPPALGEALKQSGVDLFALANNHALDMGFDGIVQTLDRLDALGLAHVGNYRSLEEKQANTPYIVDIKGIKVAFLNYSAVTNGLYLAAEHKAYANNGLGTEAAAAEAQAARAAGADVVIALLHWGKEHTAKTTGAQTRVAKGTDSEEGLLARGVDVILGSHSHVVQPAERVTYQSESGSRDTYVVYSLGNFLPDSNGWPENSGMVIYVHIEKSGAKTTVTGLSYLPFVVQKANTQPQMVRLLPVLAGLTPATDTAIGGITKTLMNKAWNYYQAMYDKPQDNIVPLDPESLTAGKE